MSKYIIEVTDIDRPNFGSSKPFDPKFLNNDRVNIQELHGKSNCKQSQKTSFSWGLLLLACLIAPMISPQIRRAISFDYTPSSIPEK